MFCCIGLLFAGEIISLLWQAQFLTRFNCFAFMPCSCDAWPAAHNQFHYCNSSKSGQSYSAPLPMLQSSIREKYLVRSNHWTTKLNSTVTVRVKNSKPDVDSRQCGKVFTVWSRGAGKSATRIKLTCSTPQWGMSFLCTIYLLFCKRKTPTVSKLFADAHI